MKPIDKKKNLNLKISEELYWDIAAIADKNSKTLSSFVREAIECYVKEKTSEARQEELRMTCELFSNR